MFDYAKGKELEVGLWTNGLNLNERLSREIIEKELLSYIIFSIDAATKETYANVKGVDVYDKAVENINKFLKLKKEKVAGMEKGTYGWWFKVKPIVGVRILKMKENDIEIEEFMNQWDWMDKTKKMINYRSRFQKLNEIENDQDRFQVSRKLSDELQEVFYTKAELLIEHAIIGHFNQYCGQIKDRSVIDVTPLKRFPCRQLKESVSIFWNGDVVLCSQDINGEFILGNLKDEKLDDIIENQRLKDIWQVHMDGEYDKLSLCINCKDWYYNPYG
jgi:radical SAM protein with 4Fe4S-binding SPASM domain